MINAIILHGMPYKSEYYDSEVASASNSHWIPWLQKQLLANEIYASTPEVPMSYFLKWELWLKEFERFEVNGGTTLVGHSSGAGFILRWLSENNNVKAGKVILVAPWVNPGEDPKWGELDFFKFKFDSNLVARTKGITIFNSDDDTVDIQQSVKKITNEISGVKYREFHGYGHFTYGDMQTTKFPELLQECLN